MRCIQLGGRPERGNGRSGIAGRLQGRGASGAPGCALLAQAGPVARGIRVLQRRPGPLPAAFECTPRAKCGVCVPGIDFQRPAVERGRLVVPAPPQLNVPHLDVRRRARRIGGGRGPVRLLHPGSRRRIGGGNEAVPALDAPRDPLFPPSVPPALFGGARRTGRVSCRPAVPHDGVGWPAAGLKASRDPAALVSACRPHAMQAGGPFEAILGGL